METLDIHEIVQHLPHRYPFLMVDRILEIEPAKRIVGVKNVTFNEPFFQGHFPGHPVMPGVLIVEAMAQITGVLASVSWGQESDGESLYFLTGVDKARFKRQVIPGDQLILKAELTRKVRDLGKFATEALVDGQVVASAEIMCVKKEAGA